MADQPDKDQRTEAATPKRQREAAEKGDVLHSKDLSTAIMVLAGGVWLAMAGPLLIGSLKNMLTEGLTFDVSAVHDFEPGKSVMRLLGLIAVPMIALFALTVIAAVAGPAVVGSLGFRSQAFAFKPEKLNPLSGIKRIFSMNGVIELVKSIGKIILIGSIGVWLLIDQSHHLVGLSAQDLKPALAGVGATFVLAVLLLGGAIAAIALVDVPAQMVQRSNRLKMSKQEIRDEHKQMEGSPEVKAAIRRRQFAVLKASARSAVQEATVVLTNPTHYAVALRYRPGEDVAPLVVARGRDATADAIRELAGESEVPILSYPQLARAIYYTSRTGQLIRDDLYMAVATVLAFVFNLDAAIAAGATQPPIEVPPGARFDENGRPQA